MKRQDYYPSLIEEQVLWLKHFAHQLPLVAQRLNLSPEELADVVADALWIAYLLGPWRTSSRAWAASLRAAMDHAQTGKHGDAALSLAFVPPALPEGVSPRAPGALTRVFKAVQRIKHTPGFDDSLGEQLGVLTRKDHRVHTSPEITLETFSGASGQCVRIHGRRWGRLGLLVQSRRADGDWERIGFVMRDKLVDARPLLVPGQPEVREYRARFWSGDGNPPDGDWSAVAKSVVGP